MNEADALVVIGTTGATSLPAHMLHMAQSRGLPIYDINPDDNPFARAAERGTGEWLQTTATEGVVALERIITDGA